jgi:hypothetical protein
MPLSTISFTPSGNIANIWHDPDTQTLIIRFKFGSRVYKYPGVSASEADGFSQSLSANDYLQGFIVPQHTASLVGSLPAMEDPAEDEQGLMKLLG